MMRTPLAELLVRYAVLMFERSYLLKNFSIVGISKPNVILARQFKKNCLIFSPLSYAISTSLFAFPVYYQTMGNTVFVLKNKKQNSGL